MGQLEFIEEAEAGWSRLRPDEDLSALRTIQLVVWCGRLAEYILGKAASAAGFRSRGDYEVLALLRRAEPSLLTPQDVADQLLTSPSGMTGKVDRLEHQAYLERTSDPDDRRVVRLELTDVGRRQVDLAFASSLSLYRQILSRLQPAGQNDLPLLLEVVLQELDALTSSRRLWEPNR